MKKYLSRILFFLLLGSPVFCWLACGGGNNGGFDIRNDLITCAPSGFLELSGTDLPLYSGLPFTAVVRGPNTGRVFADQLVDVTFGDGVNAAVNLNDDVTMDLAGDVGTTDADGTLFVEVDCTDPTDSANPCSVTFSTSLYHFGYSCTAGYQDLL